MYLVNLANSSWYGEKLMLQSCMHFYKFEKFHVSFACVCNVICYILSLVIVLFYDTSAVQYLYVS